MRAVSDWVLEASELRFRYPGAKADVLRLDGLRLQAGERILVRGPSGCGKSTLLALACGVMLPTSGSVRLLGQEWSVWGSLRRDAKRADHVGIVFQQFNLLPYLGVLDNATLPCRFSARRRRRAQAESGSVENAARDLLQALGLPADLESTPVGRLSVGQQQRVAAARALMGSPELLIADEPTSALDDDRRDAFMEVLLHACERSGCAVLMVSHDMRLAPHFDATLELPACAA